ncbi:MAG: saccharopine dehydrogenase C-terminal domain-containing protein [Thermoanaerobaculia bacterium]
MKHVLVLGAGLVSPPLVRYFLARGDWHLTIAAAELGRIEPIIADRLRARSLRADVSDAAALRELMRDADVVVNLLPATMLPHVARAAIDERKPMVSTSYLPGALLEMNEEAERAGVLLLCEAGFDPGLDHMSAIRVIRGLRHRGGRVTHVSSHAGGFPALDANSNPWGYKFSWSPRAAILAARNGARFLSEGRVVEIAGPDLFAHRWRREIEGAGVFEIYANRDALVYLEPYRLADDALGMFRGTIRRAGWSATMQAVASLGLFESEPVAWPDGTTWRDVIARRIPAGKGSIVERVAGFVGTDADSDIITRLEWAGLLSDRPVAERNASPLDLFIGRLERLMHYEPGERDMIAMQHEFRAEFPDGRVEEITSWLVREGQPWGDSAMSQTVSVPAAIAARLIGSGTIRATGVHIPVSPEIVYPILDELEERGIRFEERTQTKFPGPV